MLRINFRFGSICLFGAMLGISSLSAGAAEITWTGDGLTDDWSDPDNWDLDRVPLWTDNVIINSDDDIVMDVENLYSIKSLEVYGAPGGSVTVVPTHVWRVLGNFWSADEELYSLTLGAGASLEIHDMETTQICRTST